jgi:hypothetical protein
MKRFSFSAVMQQSKSTIYLSHSFHFIAATSEHPMQKVLENLTLEAVE